MISTAHAGIRVIILSLSLVCGVWPNLSQESLGAKPMNESAVKFKVALVPQRTEFVVGEPVQVDIKISNVGESGVFIANWVSMNRSGAGGCSLHLYLKRGDRDLPTRVGIVDRVPWIGKRDLNRDLVKHFILLQPGRFFGSSRDVREYFEALRKPGR